MRNGKVYLFYVRIYYQRHGVKYTINRNIIIQSYVMYTKTPSSTTIYEYTIRVQYYYLCIIRTISYSGFTVGYYTRIDNIYISHAVWDTDKKFQYYLISDLILIVNPLRIS